ncbi:hypothetical protein HN51_020981 [Arachis hypogaea]|uniref:Acyl-[acyl-carrier-protein] hydrolase n=1 Tax=Arachis hypogaea TaxID=3818 RepID=A0A445EIR5_ARAHY|nr:palmitoyl-acyl carrier protein thioesterase, chloroplastic-like [Arachis hypogaea]QHO51854.1 Palmitoyl-acyl carrier protein thioesterase [Arachis hypogaea]RYR75243.1 hypothetical protein Ahy_A02g009910 [Arachis hypogaea]
MVAPIIITAAPIMCAFHNVMLPSQNYGTKKGIKQGLGVKRGSCGGLQIKANAQNHHNGDDKISKVVSKSSIRQNFTIRSYEVDANGIASVETLMNYFQGSMIYHGKTLGAYNDVAGTTKEMIKRNLVWVYSEMQVLTYRYPKWDDVVEVETWVSTAGMNAVRFNWIMRDFKTNQVLNTASSVSVLMNKLTRRLSKMPEEIRRELESYLVNSRIIIEDDHKKIPKLDDTTADYICTGLRPQWSDIDVNFHVNNAKYISWILEGIPESILMNYELSSMSLKFKRECKIDSKLQSLAEVCSDNNNSNNNVEYNHMVRFENGVEILRGRTKWRSKLTHNFDIFNHVPEASIKDL